MVTLEAPGFVLGSSGGGLGVLAGRKLSHVGRLHWRDGKPCFPILVRQCHFHGFTFKPSLAAALRGRSSKLKNTFACKTSAAATCSKSKLRVPSVGV